MKNECSSVDLTFSPSIYQCDVELIELKFNIYSFFLVGHTKDRTRSQGKEPPSVQTLLQW